MRTNFKLFLLLILLPGAIYSQSIKKQVIAVGEAPTSENKILKSTIGQTAAGNFQAEGFRVKVGYRVLAPVIPMVTLSTSATTVEEGKTMSFKVSLNKPSYENVVVDLLFAGTSKKLTDFNWLLGSTPNPESITIAAGDTVATINLVASDDESVEGDETMVLSIAAVSKAEADLSKTYTVNLVDNDFNDTDGDGLKDNVDRCPNSTAGAMVDINGCEIFNLAATNYQIAATSASCVGAATGSYRVTVGDKTYAYVVKTTGPAGFTKTETFDATKAASYSLTGLVKGAYTVCFTIASQPGYEQCFDLTVSEPAALKTTSRLDPNTNVLKLDLSGSEKYIVTINGVSETVNTSSFSKQLGTGLNTVTVSTELGCQGLITEEIFVSEEVLTYPNPTTGIVHLYIPGTDSEVQVSLNSMNATFLNETKEVKANREVDVDLTQMPAGSYVIQVLGNHVRKTMKIVKQ
ncbi:MAG: hypothetical protein RLZZ402_993 [Bacteroidota bacterium]|jgi:hypothetical protein